MIKPTDPAFPIAQSVAELVDPGLTKREYIATYALAGILANRAKYLDTMSRVERDAQMNRIAEDAADCADELISALNEAQA